MIKKKELIIGIIFIILAYYLTISSAIPVELPLQVNNLSEIKEMITDSRLKSISISHEHKGIVFEANHSNMSVNFTLNNGRVKAKAIIDYFDQNTVKKFKKINSTHWRGEAVYYDPLSIEELWVYIQGNDLVFSFPHTSSPCVNCATGTTSKTLNSLSNGSWINLTNPIQNVTAVDVVFTGLPENYSSWSSVFGTTINNPQANSVMNISVSNLSGVSNQSFLFLNGSCHSNCSDLIVVNGDNNTELPFWWKTNATDDGLVGVLYFNNTDNSTKVNIYTNNTGNLTWRSNGTKTFPKYCCEGNKGLAGWTVTQGSGNVTVDADNKLVMKGEGGTWGTTGILSTETFSSPYILEFYTLTTRSGSTLAYVGMNDDIGSSTNGNLMTDEGNQYEFQMPYTGRTTVVSLSALNTTSDFKLEVNGTNNVMWFYNGTYRHSTNTVGDTATYNKISVSKLDSATYTYVWDIRLLKTYTVNPTFDGWSTGKSNTGVANTLVYAIPSGHPMSENKTSSTSSIKINLTLTSGVSLQNVQLFTNSTNSYSATLTVNYTNNTEITNESFYNGFWIMNATFKLPVNSTNVSFNYTATYPSYDNIGTINVTSTQESNRTSTTTSGSYINTTFYQLPDIDVYINYSRAYDVLAVLTQPTNQSTVIGSTLTHSITVTDSNYLSQNISWDYEGDGTIDTYGSSNQKTYNSIGTRSGRVYVNTTTTLNTWDNQTKVFTTVVNQSITISNVTNITQAENSTVYVDIDASNINGTASFSTNRSDLFTNFNSVTGVGSWLSNYSSNATYYVDFGVNDTYGNTNANVTMIINITNTVLPVSTSQVSPTSVTNGNTVNISLTINGSGINVTSAIVRVEKPNAVIQNFTMSCSGTTDTLCFKVYTTAAGGEHMIRFFYLKDETLTENQVASLLTFTATAAPSGGGGGGGGGTSVTNIIVAATPTPTPSQTSVENIMFTNITDIRTDEQLQSLGECLSKNFLLPNKCTKISTVIITDIYNWWIYASAFLFSLLTVFLLAIISKEPRNYKQDFILYGSISIFIIILFNLLGFNLYIVNYITNNPAPGFMSLSIGMWSIGMTILGDNIFRKDKI